MKLGEPTPCSKCGCYNPPGRDCFRCSGGLKFKIREAMKLDEMYEKLKNGEMTFDGKCCDCGVDVSIKSFIDGEHLVVEGGSMFRPPSAWNCPDDYLYKCQQCYDKDSKYYPATEVYSRCVGYYRPTSQWNDGKKAEFECRKSFNIHE